MVRQHGAAFPQECISVQYARNLSERNGSIDTDPAAIAAQLMMTRYLPAGSAELPIPSVTAI
jgi:hypothetical protein